MLLQIEELEGNEEYKKTEEKAKAEFKKEMENLGENDYERYKILHQEYIRKIEEAQQPQTEIHPSNPRKQNKLVIGIRERSP